jgi:hypothetical protein
MNRLANHAAPIINPSMTIKLKTTCSMSNVGVATGVIGGGFMTA